MKQRKYYYKQRPALYFDENIPLAIFEHFNKSSYWRKKFKFVHAIQLGNRGLSDSQQFSFCKRKNYTLVSIDDDFNNDQEFPFGNMPGIIIIKIAKTEESRIVTCLSNLLDFLNNIPLPKMFLGDSKFLVSLEGCVVRGRDAETRAVKTFHILAGQTTLKEVREHFSY